jgi:hypothetical protein
MGTMKAEYVSNAQLMNRAPAQRKAKEEISEGLYMYILTNYHIMMADASVSSHFKVHQNNEDRSSKHEVANIFCTTIDNYRGLCSHNAV